jgi:hypothetical protein
MNKTRIGLFLEKILRDLTKWWHWWGERRRKNQEREGKDKEGKEKKGKNKERKNKWTSWAWNKNKRSHGRNKRWFKKLSK